LEYRHQYRAARDPILFSIFAGSRSLIDGHRDTKLYMMVAPMLRAQRNAKPLCFQLSHIGQDRQSILSSELHYENMKINILLMKKKSGDYDEGFM
jgi:hypothetical protein